MAGGSPGSVAGAQGAAGGSPDPTERAGAAQPAARLKPGAAAPAGAETPRPSGPASEAAGPLGQSAAGAYGAAGTRRPPARTGSDDATVQAPPTEAPSTVPEQPAAPRPPAAATARPTAAATAPSGKADPQPGAPRVKGIYITASNAGGSKMDSLIRLLDETELNAVVIDLKNDYGFLTFNPLGAEARKWGSPRLLIPDLPGLMRKLADHNIYPIARIVVFKDTLLARKNPAFSFRNADGTLWQNGRGDSFVNPYDRQVWEYNVAVAKEAARLGFKEIQFDYVRFAEGFENRAGSLDYTKDSRSRTQAVTGFVQYAREQLHPLGVRVSVDIFGYAASVPAAEGIGQDFGLLSRQVDVISPMIYPSHYSEGWYGAAVPDAAPYQVIEGASRDTLKKLRPLGSDKPVVRPWLQDFTAGWVPGHIAYGKKEIEDQIRALKDNGIVEFLLWNASNAYTGGVSYGVEEQTAGPEENEPLLPPGIGPPSR
ncbi:putative glycoside hydrolase [Paenibacillus sp. CC-CFT747]|nr:putative glycoside hydrolase [Paenibacillus sp. CC-CFT747]